MKVITPKKINDIIFPPSFKYLIQKTYLYVLSVSNICWILPEVFFGKWILLSQAYKISFLVNSLNNFFWGSRFLRVLIAGAYVQVVVSRRCSSLKLQRKLKKIFQSFSQSIYEIRVVQMLQHMFIKLNSPQKNFFSIFRFRYQHCALKCPKTIKERTKRTNNEPKIVSPGFLRILFTGSGIILSMHETSDS